MSCISSSVTSTYFFFSQCLQCYGQILWSKALLSVLRLDTEVPFRSCNVFKIKQLFKMYETQPGRDCSWVLGVVARSWCSCEIWKVSQKEASVQPEHHSREDSSHTNPGTTMEFWRLIPWNELKIKGAFRWNLCRAGRVKWVTLGSHSSSALMGILGCCRSWEDESYPEHVGHRDQLSQGRLSRVSKKKPNPA